jgi:hypothetical protein
LIEKGYVRDTYVKLVLLEFHFAHFGVLRLGSLETCIALVVK